VVVNASDIRVAESTLCAAMSDATITFFTVQQKVELSESKVGCTNSSKICASDRLWWNLS